MLKKTYKFILAFSVSLLFFSSSFAQTILTHDTGTLTTSMYDNGYIGHNFSASTGSGVVFGGPDAMYTAGFVLGYSLTRTVGLVGSFTGGSPAAPIMADWSTTTPFGSFGSDGDFNEIATAVYTDGNAPVDNQVGVSVQQRSLSNTGDDFIIIEYTITNTSGSDITGLYAGIFSDWDVGAANYILNRGGYDQARNLAYQFENGGAADTRYYGYVALNGMAGARVTTNTAFGAGSGPVRDSVFHWISTYMGESIAANGDYRSFIGSGPYDIPNNGSMKVGFALVAGTDLSDLQANSDGAQSTWDNVVLPVELTSFAASISSGQVTLNWSTATEINNMMFEVERKSTDGQFIRIGYVDGAGTTTDIQNYSYTDAEVSPGKYSYRLKQVDFSGEFEYSNEVEVDVTAPLDFNLAQNYPNPFNPATQINFSIAEAGIVKLSVYNLLGQEVKALVNGFKEAGTYNVSFNASELSSGTYFYRLESGNLNQVKKMILTK